MAIVFSPPGLLSLAHSNVDARRHLEPTGSQLAENQMSRLFAPAHIGPYTLSHRVVMAPLTRMRSGPGNIPGDLTVEYYRQRASGVVL